MSRDVKIGKASADHSAPDSAATPKGGCNSAATVDVVAQPAALGETSDAGMQGKIHAKTPSPRMIATEGRADASHSEEGTGSDTPDESVGSNSHMFRKRRMTLWKRAGKTFSCFTARRRNAKSQMSDEDLDSEESSNGL
ncbi:hypothetical protein ACP70R_037564 [Stipagrostis hirtigluma subsp. patula]